MTVALLVRVSADDETPRAARVRSNSGPIIHAILPLAQENIYIFEPVVDEDELHSSLMTPFELTHAAEIVHREYDGEGIATMNPFRPGSLDLHDLHWTLLRQPRPR